MYILPLLLLQATTALVSVSYLKYYSTSYIVISYVRSDQYHFSLMIVIYLQFNFLNNQNDAH